MIFDYDVMVCLGFQRCHKTKHNFYDQSKAARKIRMDDDFGSFHELDYLEMPQTSNSTRTHKILARSRNTVSLSALTVSTVTQIFLRCLS